MGSAIDKAWEHLAKADPESSLNCLPMSIKYVFTENVDEQMRASMKRLESQLLTGDYLGQPLPGDTPEVFAPGIVTRGRYTRDVAMTPDGSELYFGVMLGGITAIMEIHKGEDGTEEVIVAIVDTGVDWDHEDLQSNVWENMAEDADGDGQTMEFISGEWLLDPDDLNDILTTREPLSELFLGLGYLASNGAGTWGYQGGYYTISISMVAIFVSLVLAAFRHARATQSN